MQVWQVSLVGRGTDKSSEDAVGIDLGAKGGSQILLRRSDGKKQRRKNPKAYPGRPLETASSVRPVLSGWMKWAPIMSPSVLCAASGLFRKIFPLSSRLAMCASKDQERPTVGARAVSELGLFLVFVLNVFLIYKQRTPNGLMPRQIGTR